MLLGVAVAILYGSTLADRLVGGDGLFYSTILADGGYGHPPGYPLYSLYLRASGVIWPWAPPLASSVATALLGLAAVLILYRAARAWRLAPPVSLSVATAFGLAPGVWLLHTQAEVLALHHLLAATLLLCAGPSGPLRGLGRIAAIGLIGGLGLAHHHALVLMTPVGAWGLWLGLRETSRPWLATAAGLFAALVGLTPYAVILSADPTHFQFPWADVSSWSRLAEIVTRERYGTLELASGGTRRPLLHIGYLFISAIADTYYLPTALALVGLVAYLRPAGSRHDNLSRPAVAGLAGALVLAGPVFVSLFNLEPVGYRATTVRKLHLLFEMLLVFTAGLGLQVLADTLDRPRLVWLAAPALLAAGLLVGRPTVLDHRGPEIEQYLEDTFERLPERAVVLGADDLAGFGLDYYHRALDRRLDVDYVHLPSLRPDSTYTRLLADDLPVAIPFDDGDVDRTALVARLVATDRPVFVSPAVSPETVDRWPSRPRGTLTRIYPPDHPPVPPAEAFRDNTAFLDAAAIDPTSDPPPTTWRFAPLLHYATIWERIAERLEGEGRSDLATRARRRRDAFAPNYETWVD